MKSIVFLSKTGCLLPLLILFNLFFGLIFFKPIIWLGVGTGLVALFIINAMLVTRKVFSAASRNTSRVIDIEAEVVDDSRKYID